MADGEGGTEPDFTCFRPYEERGTHPFIKGERNIEITEGNTRIMFQKTPPPQRKQITQLKKIPRVDSWSNQSLAVSSGLSRASAVGMTTGSLGTIHQSHRSVVESRLGMMMSSSNDRSSKDKHWMPDKLCPQCSECETKFSVFVRRHHCRICGRIFCHSCTNYSVPGNELRPPLSGKVRVCRSCLEIFYEMNTAKTFADMTNPAVPVIVSVRGRSNSVSSDHQGSPELESLSAMSFNPSVAQSRVSWDDGTLPDSEIISSPSRGSCVEFDNPTPLRYGARRRTSRDDRVLALTEDEIDVRLQEIWTRFTDKTTGMAPQSKRHRFGIRTFQNAYVGQEIVDWLISNGHAYSREMAIRICQTFIDTKYLNVVSSNDQLFRDSKEHILELGESGTLSPLARSPTIMDAPNWFLSEEGEESMVLEGRGSLHEANLDPESGRVMFHRHKAEKVRRPLQLPLKSNLSPPEIIEIQEEEEEAKNMVDNGTSSETNLVQDYYSKNDVAPPKEGYPLLHPTSPTKPSEISYSILTPGAVLKAFPLTQASHFALESESTSVQSEIKQEHILHHQSHLEQFLSQQLICFGLSMSWLEIIQPLILEASRKVRTHVTPDDFMDIQTYCKVKKIPGGRKSSCSFVHGAVFSKHVSHKKMELSLRNPRILMLRCGFEFQRKESQLSSFDTLILQEQEYLKNLVDRVKVFRPDIILVQKSVARFALEMFHHHRMVVVVNVKPSVMARVARSTQADLLSNLDQLYFDVKMGTCGRFCVRTFTLPDGIRKTLMYFDECEPMLGGVILLQGAENQELKKVKKVVQFGLQIAHNMRLESAFLTDEFAVPTKALGNLNDMIQSYATPPASPEPHMYPFSTSILDKPVSPVLIQVSKAESTTETTKQEGLYACDSLEDLERGGEEKGEEEGKENHEDTCPLPEQDKTNEATTERGRGGSDAKEDVPVVRIRSESCLLSETVFKNVLESRLISTSPHVLFTVPYLQTEQGIRADSKKYLPDVVYWSQWFQPRTPHQDTPKSCYLDFIVHSLQGKVRSSSQSVTSRSEQHKSHNYKSVSSHPFVSSAFLCSTSSSEMKAALADFRARASHPNEPNCYFFPSARKAADVDMHLQRIFASSKDFEEKAKNYHEFHNRRKPLSESGLEVGKDGGELPHSPGLSKRTTRWMVPEKEHLAPSSPAIKNRDQPVVATNEPDLAFQQENVEKSLGNNLTKVFEGRGVSPEPMVLQRTDNLISTDNELGLSPNTDDQLDCLDPFNHQSISLVFSSTCHDRTKHLYPCVPPCIIPMNYYGRNDIPLGEFLHRYCFREEYICQSCNIDMSSHQRHFVHGQMELRITMHQLGASIPGGDKRIFTWCVCPQCTKQSTPLVPLSEDSLLFSFAKFLELKFYGREYTCYNFQEGLPPNCTHPVHSYVQFFSLQDRVATFELYPIDIFELRVPPQDIHLDSLQVVHHNYVSEISRLSKLIETVFYHIKQYIELYSVHMEPIQEMTRNCMDRCLGLRASLRLKVKRIKMLSTKLDGTQNRVVVSKELKEECFLLQDLIAELKRNLAESVDGCNKDLNEVDVRLRECLSKKDPSPRDTPLSATLESDYSPKTSPHLPHRNIEKGGNSAGKKHLTRSSGEDDMIDAGKLKPRLLTHQRNLSDSLTLRNKDLIREPVHERVGSDGQLPISLENHASFQTTPTDSGSHDSDPEDGRELVSALKTSVTSAEVMSVVYAEDLIAKIRGKDIDDPTKFYYLRSTPISTSVSDVTDLKNNATSKKFVAGNSSSKIEETDSGSGGGIKSKIASEKLFNLLSKPFQKLPSPFETTEHHLLRGKLQFQISVYEDEPTSIIAFTLCSREYAHELKLQVDEARKMGLTESVISTTSPRGNSEGDAQTGAKTSGGFIKNVISEIRKKKLQSSTSVASPPALEELPPFDQPDPLPEEEDVTHPSGNIQWNSSPESNDRFSSSHENGHISLEFADDTTKFFCKVYYAQEFRKLRESLHLEGEDSYIRSLARCVRYEAKGGKSKSMFLKTFEDRLIMKQVQLVEITSFIEFAPQYFQHVSEAIMNKRPLVLAKILGAYSIGFRNSKTGRSKRHNVIIMENLLFNHKCTKVFDLKGSMRGRYVTLDPKKDGTGDVLMDENFLEYIYSNPVYVWPHSKAVLMQAIINDTEFLSKNSIMDYSLLTALDKAKGELVVGIIDFVRPFTLDKRIEMIVKKAGRSVLPTVVYPGLYRKRFMEAMDRYFSPIPDKWTGLGADIRVTF